MNVKRPNSENAVLTVLGGGVGGWREGSAKISARPRKKMPRHLQSDSINQSQAKTSFTILGPSAWHD